LYSPSDAPTPGVPAVVALVETATKEPSPEVEGERISSKSEIQASKEGAIMHGNQRIGVEAEERRRRNESKQKKNKKEVSLERCLHPFTIKGSTHHHSDLPENF
jgi:hypothetical protein